MADDGIGSDGGFGARGPIAMKAFEPPTRYDIHTDWSVGNVVE